MNTLTLNFSHLTAAQQRRKYSVVFIVLVLTFASIYNEYLNRLQEVEQFENQLSGTTNKVSVLSREQAQENALLRNLVIELNTPWYQLFQAIEQIKEANPAIYLTQVEPNVKKAEIKMNGEVKVLSDLINLIDSLNEHPQFEQALLINQHVNSDSAYPLVFSLKVRWLHHE